MIDHIAAFLFAASIATIVVVLINAYDDPPTWWRP